MTLNPDLVLCNICGVLIHIHPQQQAEMEQRLLALPGLEIHAVSPEGKMVVTLESDSFQQVEQVLTQLQSISGVLSASLVYHHSEQLEKEH